MAASASTPSGYGFPNSSSTPSWQSVPAPFPLPPGVPTSASMSSPKISPGGYVWPPQSMMPPSSGIAFGLYPFAAEEYYSAAASTSSGSESGLNQDMQHDGGGAMRSRKGASRRYKTPSPQILRFRREQANARERKRMNSLNSAFDELRTVLPDTDKGKKMSKYETLLQAQYHIYCLNKLLGHALPNRPKWLEE